MVQAPVGPATTPELVTAVSRTGALGTLAASWTEPDALRRLLRGIYGAVGGEFCVNLVLAFEQRERLEVVLDEGARFVSFSWGIDGELIGRARDRGATVLVQVGDVAEAVEVVQQGADIVIAQGVEAGGHVQGTTPLVALIGEMRPEVEVPIVAAGGIADAAAARVAVAAGADAVACGTAFLAATEADVHPAYLDRLLSAVGADTVLTTIFDVGWPNAPHRVIRNDTFTGWVAAGQPGDHGSRPGNDDAIATRDGVPIGRYSDAQPTNSTAGDIEAMALYAGLSVGHVNRVASAVGITNAIADALL